MATGRIPINGTAAIQSTIVDAKGDIIAATGADAVSRLAVGANGTTLVADSSEATGLKWAAPAGGGKVLQVVQATYSTETTTSSASYVATGLTVNITPSSATSKVLVLASVQYLAIGTAPYCLGTVSLFRDSTEILQRKDDAHGLNVAGSGDRQVSGVSDLTYLDSPATTSTIAYNVKMKVNQTQFRVQHSGSTSTIVCLEIGA